MARCPFATFEEITGPVGPFSGGPVKIVHHTTEGSTYAGAKSAYRTNRSDPHFTVAGDDIFQHIDTSLAARSLRNPPGGVETNRDSAVQIEVVGFAGSAKDVATLRSVAKLCRWLETEHGVPQRWPNGRPKTAVNGRDPGGHNRSAVKWDAESGHFGHSQVPENTHWDPAYTAAELAIVTPDAAFDLHDELAETAASLAPVAESAFGPEVVSKESVDEIVRRVLDGLHVNAQTVLGRTPSRVSVRVTVGDAAVEVVVEGAGEAVRQVAEAASENEKTGKSKRPARRSSKTRTRR